jgi:hypothetical protein
MRAGHGCSVVHIENSYASGRKKRPRGPRSTPTEELAGKQNAALHPPLVDLKTQAIVYYLHYHLQTLEDVPNISKDTSDDFMSIWMSRTECPILDLAMSSMALAVFSRTQQYPPAAIEASMTYHRLLQLAQVTFSTLHDGNVDVCLLANFFMSRYEDSVHGASYLNTGTSFTTAVQSFSHHDGALAILRTWKDNLSHSQPATDVIKHTRRGLIRSALMRNLALPEWMLEGAFFGEHGLELEYDCIVVRIASVRQRLVTLLKTKTGSQRTSHEVASAAEALNQEARHIDEALQDWSGHFPGTWLRQQHTLSSPPPWPRRGFYSPIVHSYSNTAYAAVWNLYYATRMLINSTRLRVLELSHPHLRDSAHEQRLECLSHINIMSDDLASSLPFCLQRFKVTGSRNSPSHHNMITLNTTEDIKPYVSRMTVWPLTIASSLKGVDVKLKSWFRSELASIGRMVGYGVLECAESDQWLQL